MPQKQEKGKFCRYLGRDAETGKDVDLCEYMDAYEKDGDKEALMNKIYEALSRRPDGEEAEKTTRLAPEETEFYHNQEREDNDEHPEGPVLGTPGDIATTPEFEEFLKSQGMPLPAGTRSVTAEDEE